MGVLEEGRREEKEEMQSGSTDMYTGIDGLVMV
jgi:hypothetical protein